MSNWEFAFDAAVAAAAVAGVVLGIVNFVLQLRSDRAKVKIVPLAAHYIGLDYGNKDVYFTNSESFLRDGQPPESVAFRLTNLSHFPIKIREVGFLVKRSKSRHSVYQPPSDSGQPWPQTMEARSSITVYTALTYIMEAVDVPTLSSAFVATDCGKIFKGGSPALRQMTAYFDSNP